MGFLQPLEPDGEGLIVFTEALPPGRYFMGCFLPDETDPAETRHVAKGMARPSHPGAAAPSKPHNWFKRFTMK